MNADPADEAAEHEENQEQGAAEQEAPEAWEASEQLRAFAPHLFARSANLMHEASVAGDMVAGNKNIGVHLHTHAQRLRTAAGPLPAAELAATAKAFTATRRYDEALDALRSHQVLVLRGHRGTGRRTAAVRLLAQLSAPRSEVIALDPDADPGGIAEQLRPGCGHLVADPMTGRDAQLRDVHLHAVRKQLADQGGFLVVTADPETSFDSVAAVDWQAPEPAEVVRSHLAARLGEDGSADPEAACARLLALPEVAAYLRSRPTPSEAAGFAGRLHAHGAGRLDAEQLTAYGRAAAAAVVEEWFGEDGPQLRDKAFLISLAVLDGSPYPLVAELGDLLYQRLLAVERPSRAAGLRVFAASREARLRTARAREYEGTTESPWGRLPQRLVAFQGEDMWSTVLEHVWTSHPAARAPMVEWFTGLGTDQRILVRLRAAVAVGSIAGTDFPFTLDTLLAPWAVSDRLLQRQLAAWALCACAEGGQQAVVRRLLNSWSSGGSTGRRWTAARTHALLGATMPESALRDLALIGGQPDAVLQTAVAQSLETLLRGPAAPTVLSRLCDWSASGSRLRPVACQAFLRATGGRHDESGGRGGFPGLLRLALSDEAAWQWHARLWRTVLGDREVRRDALDRLARWVEAAGWNPEVETALARLLPELVGSDNDAERLDHLLRRVYQAGDRDGTRPAPVDNGRLLGAVRGARRIAGAHGGPAQVGR